MKFDVIIGNPPYQMDDGGNKNSAKPIYQLFVNQAIKLNPRYLTMIIPSRWFAGGKGLDDFRKMMLTNHHISRLVDYSNAKDCFPGISLGGGVCYFLWSRNDESQCLYTNYHDGIESTRERVLDEYPVFVRYNEALSIIHKIEKKTDKYMSDVMGGRNPFGFESFVKGDSDSRFEDDCKLFYSGGVGYVRRSDVVKQREIIDDYKVMISRASAEHAGEPDSGGMFNVLSVVKVLKPNEVCTDSYLIAYSSKDETEAQNFAKYVCSRFFRFLVLQSVTSISLSKEKFQFVPYFDGETEWNDTKLYDFFEIAENEQKYIESLIKEKVPNGD